MTSVIRLGSRNTMQLNDLVARALDDAARCLTDVTGKEVAFDASVVRLAPAEDAMLVLGNPDRTSIALRCGVRGGLSGSIHLVATLPDIQRMIEKLSGEPTAWIGTPDEHSASLLTEYATILSAFVLNAIATATGIQAVPTAPVIQTGLRRDLLTIQHDGSNVLMTEIIPFVDGGVSHSLFFLQFDAASLDMVMRWMWRNSADERARARQNGLTIFTGAS